MHCLVCFLWETWKNSPCKCIHPSLSGVCPLLCNAHGSYVSGECICQPGWKGKECQLRHSECEVSDCNGHGRCVDGGCSCIKGFKGEFCDQG